MKSIWESEKKSELIVINSEEAASGHVDDLLARQSNLRGEKGIVAGRKRSWYYQTWFILMCAGAVGASAAWALLEPYFDDMHYYQGTIEAMNPNEVMPRELTAGDTVYRMSVTGKGWIQIKGQKIWLLGSLREVLSDSWCSPSSSGSRRLPRSCRRRR
ncbi:MAG: hypothetical protein HY815_07470 [Candidatus Riflebacteria bacterium]|nr:hypothetical protein [Candidatus Riflebacteria bacterium]